MRKFNLKGTVAQRLMGIENDHPIPEEASAEKAGKPEKDSNFAGSVTVAWRTDVGKIRKSNQDAVILSGRLFGIADGMGGHNGGETAACGMRDGLIRELDGREPNPDALLDAVRTVNGELWKQQEQDQALTGMGTTLTAMWLDNENAYLVQVGDSRAYLLRNQELRQVTEDHSMVADMVRRGILTEEQAACHPMRNYITRAIGTEESIEADRYTVRREAGDRWLICSDGLYGQMTRSALQEIMALPALEEAADKLLYTALENGGRDNISLVLLEDKTGVAEPELIPEENGSGEGAE